MGHDTSVSCLYSRFFLCGILVCVLRFEVKLKKTVISSSSLIIHMLFNCSLSFLSYCQLVLITLNVNEVFHLYWCLYGQGGSAALRSCGDALMAK